MTPTQSISTLAEEIQKFSGNIFSTSYSMSVGELVSMYRDGELDLHPEFQRFFRWTDEQKSRFIESLLLEIPIPPIFVAVKEDSKWEVIDGLQRLSTILQLMGELKDQNGKVVAPLILKETKYLPGLKGKQWMPKNPDMEDPETEPDPNRLPEMVRIAIKRARLDFHMLKASGNRMAKYEIFQRLNTGGSLATPQEVRNCLLVMTSQVFFEWFKNLGDYPNFRKSLILTDRRKDEAFALELVTRFIVMVKVEIDKLKEIDELDSFLDEQIVDLADNSDFDFQKIQSSFEQTFDFLYSTLEENGIRKYNSITKKYSGPILMPMFEIVAVGLGFHLLSGYPLPEAESFKEQHQQILEDPKIKKYLTGTNARTRIPNTIDYGRKWFQRWLQK